MLNFISFRTLRSLCVDFIIFFIPVALLWTIFPRILEILSPFIAGILLFYGAKPLCIRLKKRLPPSISAFISLLLISATVFFLLRLIFSHLAQELSSLGQNPGRIYNRTVPIIAGKLSDFTDNAALKEFFSSAFEALRNQFLELMTKLSGKLFNLAKNIPSMLISIFASVFTAFFLLRDYEDFSLALKKFFGKGACHKFTEIKNSFLTVVFSYLKAQLIIESIIFAVLFAGFMVLGMDYALITAFFAALIDAVPILGTGTMLVPISIFNFLTGNPSRGWAILILYGIAVLTRQLCEPKIIGSKLGIHPLLTIFALYTGMKLFGIAGLIFGPIAAILIKKALFPEKVKV